jgi:hypothetical protein
MKIMFEGTHDEVVREMREFLCEPVTITPAEPIPVPVDHSMEESTPVDSDGEPWDAEKHSSTKSMTADGKWKKKRQSKKAEPKPDEPSLTKEIMGECSRLLSSNADMVVINKEALEYAGFEDQYEVWVPDAPVEKLEKYLEYLKSK